MEKITLDKSKLLQLLSGANLDTTMILSALAEMTVPDRLEDILEHQHALSKRVSLSKSEFDALDNKGKSDWVNRYLMAISSESEELRKCFPFKWWSKKNEIDWDAAQEEGIDLFHFVLNLLLLIGFDTDGHKLHSDYMAKNQINHQRQDSGTY
jgi:dimeric dUTPase (all-alpha-NTP-PPase superfamily)